VSTSDGTDLNGKFAECVAVCVAVRVAVCVAVCMCVAVCVAVYYSFLHNLCLLAAAQI